LIDIKAASQRKCDIHLGSVRRACFPPRSATVFTLGAVRRNPAAPFFIWRPGAGGGLFRTIAAHFALEERFMREHRYDQAAQHKADHARLLDGLRGIMVTIGTGRAIRKHASPPASTLGSRCTSRPATRGCIHAWARVRTRALSVISDSPTRL